MIHLEYLSSPALLPTDTTPPPIKPGGDSQVASPRAGSCLRLSMLVAMLRKHDLQTERKRFAEFVAR